MARHAGDGRYFPEHAAGSALRDQEVAASARGRTPLGAGRDLNDRGGRVAVLCPAKAARRASQLLAWPSPWAKEGLRGGLRLDRAKLPVGSGAHVGQMWHIEKIPGRGRK